MVTSTESVKKFFIDLIYADASGNFDDRIYPTFPDLEVSEYPLCVVDMSTRIQKRDYLYPGGTNWRGVVSFSVVSKNTLEVDQLSDKLCDLFFNEEREFDGFRNMGLVDQSPMYKQQIIAGQLKIHVYRRDLLLDIAWYQGRN